MSNTDLNNESNTKAKFTKSELYDLNNPISNNNSKYALTTKDNPYDPFVQFRDWFMFDVQMGYNTCSYLARIAKISEQLSTKENNDEIKRAIEEIISFDFTNNYIMKVNENYLEEEL